MSQSKVTSFYALRKNPRNPNVKAIDLQFKDVDNEPRLKNIPILSQKLKPSENQKTEKLPEPLYNAKTKNNNEIQKTSKQQGQPKTGKRVVKMTKQSSKKVSKAKQELAQPKVTSFYESAQKCEDSKTQNSNSEAFSVNIDEVEDSEKRLDVTQQVLLHQQVTSLCENVSENVNSVSDALSEDSECDVSEKNVVKYSKSKNEVPTSPKRVLINSLEGTPPQKKVLVGSSPELYRMSPRKLNFEPCKETLKSHKEGIAKQEKLSVQSESEGLKELVTNFKNKIAQIRNYESNPYKPTSVISPAKEINKTSSLPTVPAYQKYSYLADPNISSSLLLPYKYKVLSEMFRSLDTVVHILNNRKEKITFEKVQEGVQKMLKRNFCKTHFAQLLTVMPAAFDVSLEKCSFKKAGEPNYELIITPVIKKDKKDKKSKSSNIVIVTPQDLFQRKKQFDENLLQLVYAHHQSFLSQKLCPYVPIETIKRWHPKFPLDSVPDIKEAILPEIPESKINSAKDVLNKIIKGPLQNKEKVVKALKEVAEESSSNEKIKTKTTCPKNNPVTKSALKGICPDLIAKIRARESAKLLECVTQSPDEVQRKAMLERLPKIMQILWHYFIAERKAAVHVDTAIEKIAHSLNSLSSHVEIKAHLSLITEEFPGWLSFVQIPKGVYITMDKNKNLNEMLRNFNCK